MTKTLDGKASGLQDAKTLKKENDAYKERQDKMFREMRPELLGRDAELKIRDRRGRNKEFEQEVENERKKTEAEEARKKVYDRWGKGVKQVEDIEKRFQEHMHEASKPLARSADDADLQDHLKNQERIDDPMLEYMRRKKQDENKKKGVKETPKYLGQFPDNRYNIRPGYRWDGVDRSNGYEKKFFSMINSKKSMEEEAYRYSTEDM
jgi:pre-mRNA-splicing factor CWC26